MVILTVIIVGLIINILDNNVWLMGNEIVDTFEVDLAAYCRKKGLCVEQVEAWKDFCINAKCGIAEQSKSLQKNLKEKTREDK